MRILANVGLFQLGWFICICQGGILALTVTIVIVALHFCLIADKQAIQQEGQLLINVLLVGIFVESLAINLGALVVQADPLALSAWLPPLWLLCLWVLFATTLRHSLLWLRSRLCLCALLAAVSAPASYYAGSLLSPYISLADSAVFSLVTIGFLWAIVLPLLMHFFVKKT